MLFESTEFGPYDKAERKAHRAFELYEDGKMSQALEELETALDINPANSSWHFDKGLALDAINRFEEAIGEYKIASQLSPEDLEILNCLAVDYTRTVQYDLAIDTFEHIQELDPTFEPCYCNRIITYTEMGQHDLAEQMFYLAQQINPDCALCYYNIGNSLFAQGQYKKAISCWLKTAELEPSHPQINYRIAQAHWSEGDTERAREHFLQELRSNPGDLDVILDFALLLLEVDDVESAKEKFNRILELQPGHASALFHLGEIVFDKGQYEQAVELFSRALAEDNSLAGPRYRLAQHALVNGREKEARAYLIAELQACPEDAEMLVSIASMFLRLAAGPEPHLPPTSQINYAHFESTQQRAPESPFLRQTNAFRTSDLDHATHCLLRAVEIDPACADSHYYLGVVSAKKGALKDAEKFFAHAIEINGEHVRALRDSAAVYVALGKLAEAVERLRRATAVSGSDPQLRKLGRSVRVLRTMEWMKGLLRRFNCRTVFKL